MKKLLLIVMMLLNLSFAEGLVKGNAYIISAIGVNNGGKVVWQSGDSNKISDGEYKLAPQVVVYDGKSYIGAATPFTGCLNNKYYLEGADQNIPCMTGVENSLNSSDTSKALSAAKGKDLQAQIDNLTAIVESLQSNPGVDFKSIYPIGSIYISVDGTNPADLFSGTQWEAIGQGRTLVGAGTGQDNNGTQKTFNNGEIGGEYSHKLLTSEMPAHSHTASSSTEGSHTHSGTTSNSGNHTHYLEYSYYYGVGANPYNYMNVLGHYPTG